MADSAQRAAWDRAACIVSWIAAANGQTIDPDKINPYKRQMVIEQPPPSPNQNAVAWKVLDQFMSGGRRRGKRKSKHDPSG